MVTPLLANEFYPVNDGRPSVVSVFAHQLVVDYKTYYHYKGLSYLLTGLGISAIFANADFDSIARDEWQKRLRGDDSNHFFEGVDDYSALSQYYIFIPLYIASMWLGEEYPDRDDPAFIGNWGYHSLRTLFIGAPQQAILTSLLGSGRPEHTDPNWQPFHYARAVSGHAFYGAVPLLNLAKSFDDPFLKAASYIASTLPAFARINNDKHYLSQAFLGWWLAFSATQIVWEADKVSKYPYCMSWQINPSIDAIYLTVNAKF